MGFLAGASLPCKSGGVRGQLPCHQLVQSNMPPFWPAATHLQLGLAWGSGADLGVWGCLGVTPHSGVIVPGSHATLLLDPGLHSGARPFSEICSPSPAWRAGSPGEARGRTCSGL